MHWAVAVAVAGSNRAEHGRPQVKRALRARLGAGYDRAAARAVLRAAKPRVMALLAAARGPGGAGGWAGGAVYSPARPPLHVLFVL